MEEIEGEGSSEMEFAEIETTADGLDSAVIFHVVTDILGFVLFMHQQIPSILQDMSLEFKGLQTEYKELEIICAQTEVKASLRRKHGSRMREVKHGIIRLEKLMKTVSSLHTALQLMISEIPHIQRVMLVLGANPMRPQHVYEVCFSHGKLVSRDAGDFTKTRAAEGLSRKAIRTLISKGAGSDSYAGPTKLFLLVKAPSSLNMPLHFLPKRDFRYSKKHVSGGFLPSVAVVIPFSILLKTVFGSRICARKRERNGKVKGFNGSQRLRFKCKTQDQEMDDQNQVAQTADSTTLMDHTSNDLIWFQCRHVVKGLVTKTSSAED